MEKPEERSSLPNANSSRRSLLNRLIVIIPAFIFVSTVVLLNVNAAKQYIPLNFSLISYVLLTPPAKPAHPQVIVSKASVIDQINAIRIQNQLPQLTINQSACTSDVDSICRNCTKITVLKLDRQTPNNQVIPTLTHDEFTLNAIKDFQATYICAQETTQFLDVKLFNTTTPTPIPDPTTSAKADSPVPPPTATVSSQDLWLALNNYRQTHQRPFLNQDEKLCQYAQKRINDHIEKRTNTPEDQYLNPDKYPLDAHQGFAADADSGYAFEVTGKNRLAENLAYWPTATTATQIIEWGWDSSTEGHREAQLSPDYSTGCIVGQDGFYVAIYGN